MKWKGAEVYIRLWPMVCVCVKMECIVINARVDIVAVEEGSIRSRVESSGENWLFGRLRQS